MLICPCPGAGVQPGPSHSSTASGRLLLVALAVRTRAPPPRWRCCWPACSTSSAGLSDLPWYWPSPRPGSPAGRHQRPDHPPGGTAQRHSVGPLPVVARHPGVLHARPGRRPRRGRGRERRRRGESRHRRRRVAVVPSGAPPAGLAGDRLCRGVPADRAGQLGRAVHAPERRQYPVQDGAGRRRQAPLPSDTGCRMASAPPWWWFWRCWRPGSPMAVQCRCGSPC